MPLFLFCGCRYKDGAGGAGTAGTNYIEVFVKVGPVDVSDNVSKDIILQMNTTIASGGEVNPLAANWFSLPLAHCTTIPPFPCKRAYDTDKMVQHGVPIGEPVWFGC